MTQQPPHEIVWTTCTAGVAARCIQVVAELGVADHMGDGPVTIADLAASRSVNPDALDRVLRLLATHGIFQRDAGAYRHTAASELLRTDHPMSMRAFVRMMGLPALWGSVTELEHSVRTGAPAVETLEPEGFWTYLQERPDEAKIFGQAMTAKAGADIAAVLAAYDFSRFSRIADIGGGRGHLLRAVLEAVPTIEGVLFDLPDVAAARDFDHERMTRQAGDFFADALPTADAYVLMEIIHDWGDEECVAILSAIRRAAPRQATVLVIESIIADEQPDAHAQTLDIIMLSVTGGRERTTSQLRELLNRAGFTDGTVIDTAGPSRILEATAA